MTARAGTRVFAILGDPVAHSLSPAMHNAGFRAAGIDATYVAFRCASDDVREWIRLLVAAGGGGNVTIPHKTVAAAFAEAGSFEATLGAVNTFASADGGVRVANTDVEGIASSIDALGEAAPTWLVLGTGGSARAAVGAAIRSGAAVAISSRDVTRATGFAAWARSAGARIGDAPDATVVINATPLGLSPDDPLPVDPALLPAVRAALDLTYRATGEPTAWCTAWRERGVAALDGREPLLHQGVAAWKLWFPGVDPPVDIMRAVLDGAVA